MIKTSAPGFPMNIFFFFEKKIKITQWMQNDSGEPEFLVYAP